MNNHKLLLRALPDRTETNNNLQHVVVAWSFEPDTDGIRYLSTKKYAHPENKTKPAAGTIIVRIHKKKFNNPEIDSAFAEAIAATHLINTKGENIFRVDVSKSQNPARDLIDIDLSSDLAVQLLRRNQEDLVQLKHNQQHFLIGHFDSPAAFLYGCNFDIHHKQLLEGNVELDAISCKWVIKKLLCRTPLGSVQITHRAIAEYLSMPLNKELSARGQIFRRPYDAVKCLLIGAREPVEDNNPHIKRLRDKIGLDAQSLFNPRRTTFVDLKITGRLSDVYLLFGFRALYSTETKQRLENSGFITW
ncbi:hypothetical protein [Vibrio barjaei]|uniref:hypothetical protein n=1 Tax=Vibrio barjaei TaxID=1676683 RepID=UPI0022833ECA|nr:hypothetical protein [Vibrio barjaei]MCY9870347.1 hypothetical protein [Vibrio barjaei]